jgi:hypothetical protein
LGLDKTRVLWYNLSDELKILMSAEDFLILPVEFLTVQRRR